MPPLDTRQQKWLPLSLNPQTCVHDTTATSQPSIPFPELGKVYSAKHQFHYLQPPFNALLPSYDQKKVNCAAAPERALESSQKRYLIFDQSDNQTRLLQCGFASAMAAETDKSLHSLKPKILLHEEHVNGQEETEMHQDTEEINALLYSDDDDCESDDDDEVMSTGQSPFPVEQQACNKTREELDETQSSDDDDGPLRKRQKLQEHSHLDQSTKLEGLSDEKLHESNISRKQETGSGLSEEQSRKDKSQTALRILESVVPGAKGKEAFLLLDEAIDYLKLLKRNLNSSKNFLFD